MAYDKDKGLVAVASGYSDGSYSYTKLSYKYLQREGLNITPDQIQDLDSYRNGNGYLKRNVLPNKAATIEWNTPYLRYEDKCKIVNAITKAFSVGDGSKAQRKLRMRFYNDWTDDYETGFFYVPDTSFQFGGLYHGEPLYMPVKLQFIAYGY